MSSHALAKALYSGPDDPVQRLVFMIVCDNAGPDGLVKIDPDSHERWAGYLALRPQTVKACIESLIDRAWMAPVANPHDWATHQINDLD